MLDASFHSGRAILPRERALLAALLDLSQEALDAWLSGSVVIDMDDGGMGSIQFVRESRPERSLGACIAQAEFIDSDGVLVNIVVNLDHLGDLYELDFWKVDFSQLLSYPVPSQLIAHAP
jgi:hypothetical protein